ncbi:MAG: GNAT family N-acetyltransferase [Chloroflexaceae bacterium]|nr:GNAT family N-acetyltransferase [Chloroflexaceae bacterium]
MKRLTPEEAAMLMPWFLPERPGPLIGLHVINTGRGACLVDRWPEPRAVLVQIGDNYSMCGDPHVLKPEDLQPHLKGFVEAPAPFVPLLKAAFPDMQVWPRIVFEQPALPDIAAPAHAEVRRLTASDVHHLHGLSDDIRWISGTWDGPEALAASGYGWGAFVAGRLAAVTCSFFVGSTYEDIGIVTEPQFRKQGLSTTCAGALCGDIRARGHLPSWTTSQDNTASRRVAEKLGFVVQRYDELYVIGVPIPATA